MNEHSDRFSVTGRLKSFRYAFNGIVIMLRGQHNAWIHAIATIAVLAAGFCFQVSAIEWLALILAISLVWVAEAINTAFESLCDVVSPDFHPQVEQSKDIAAGAVLLAAAGSVAIAVLVFLPYIRSLL